MPASVRHRWANRIAVRNQRRLCMFRRVDPRAEYRCSCTNESRTGDARNEVPVSALCIEASAVSARSRDRNTLPLRRRSCTRRRWPPKHPAPGKESPTSVANCTVFRMGACRRTSGLRFAKGSGAPDEKPATIPSGASSDATSRTRGGCGNRDSGISGVSA